LCQCKKCTSGGWRKAAVLALLVSYRAVGAPSEKVEQLDYVLEYMGTGTADVEVTGLIHLAAFSNITTVLLTDDGLKTRVTNSVDQNYSCEANRWLTLCGNAPRFSEGCLPFSQKTVSF
jgi:hypothetical protein